MNEMLQLSHIYGRSKLINLPVKTGEGYLTIRNEMKNLRSFVINDMLKSDTSLCDKSNLPHTFGSS